MKAIYKRELGAYFHSMQAYIFLALFVCITGIFFSIVNISYGYNDLAGYVLSNSYYMMFIYAIVVPILTMRMFAEEKKQKTDQLLLTAPVSVWEIVLGKYFACMTVFMIGVVIISIFPVIIGIFGNIPIANTISGYIGMILFSACMMAIGTMISSLTEEPVISGIVSAVIGLLVMFFGSLVSILPDGAVPTLIFFGIVIIAVAVIFYLDTRKIQIAGIAVLAGAVITAGLYFLKKDWFVYGLTSSLNWLSLEKRYEEFLNGILNFSSVIYMLSVSAVCLFLTTRIIRRRRWR